MGPYKVTVEYHESGFAARIIIFEADPETGIVTDIYDIIELDE